MELSIPVFALCLSLSLILFESQPVQSPQPNMVARKFDLPTLDKNNATYVADAQANLLISDHQSVSVCVCVCVCVIPLVSVTVSLKSKLC